MKKLLFLFFLLVIPLVSAERYIFLSIYYPTDIINEEGYIQLEKKDHYIETYGKDTERIYNNCIDFFINIPVNYYENIKLIRVWDNHPKKGQIAGLWFPSGIIHIYDGCYYEDTIIHELAHQDTKSIKHDSFFWLSYYRIKWIDYQ